jgi:hypothetical protein
VLVDFVVFIEYNKNRHSELEWRFLYCLECFYIRSTAFVLFGFEVGEVDLAFGIFYVDKRPNPKFRLNFWIIIRKFYLFFGLRSKNLHISKKRCIFAK